MWTEKEYVDPFMIRCLNSIAKSLKVLASKKQSRQSSFNPKFYAIYRHYIKYVQTHPWYTKKLSVIDFYCRILNIAYRCGLTNPKLVMSCKNDYLHIKKEYENARKYLQYLDNLDKWISDVLITINPEEIDYNNGPKFHGKEPSRKMLARLQYDPTSNLIDNVVGMYLSHAPINHSLIKGLHYQYRDCYKFTVDYILNRRAFFYGECCTGYPFNPNDFGTRMISWYDTPYSTSNKQDYLKKLRGEDDE